MTASTTENCGEGGRGKGEGQNPSSIFLDTTPEDHHIARMAAVALGLTILENAIPSPLPGVKPGLANIVTLIVLARYSWGGAGGGSRLCGGAARLALPLWV